MISRNKQRETIFFIILGLFFSLYYIFTSDFSFSILPHNHSVTSILQSPKNELLAGKTIRGEIQASEDNLGIIAVRINTFSRENTDIIDFKIKEKDETGWYNEASYRTTFGHNDLYSFGFPPIPNSKGKRYIFEIKSTHGTIGNGITISANEPVIVSKYKFSKQELLNPYKLQSFLFKKTYYMLANTDALFVVFAFFIPFLYSIFPNHPKKKLLFLTIIVLIVITHSLILTEVSSLFYLYVMICWVMLVKNDRHKFHFTSLFALSLLALTPVVYAMIGEDRAVRTVSWSFLLLGVLLLFSVYSTVRDTYGKKTLS